jgi:multiple sugar transport system permease protein
MISKSFENAQTPVQVAPARSAALQTLMRWLGRIVAALFALGIVVFVLLPFYWMLKSSFQTNSEIIAVPPIWIPQDFTLEGYQRALTMIPFARYLTNSMVIATATTVFSALLASSAAYVLARYPFPGATAILAIFLFTQLIPPITRVFPVYFLIKNLDLINTSPGAMIG